MPDYKFINYSITNRVATIALNTPEKLNAFHHAMCLELVDAIAQAEADAEVRVVILTGEGRAFAAGADLTQPMPHRDRFVEIHTAEYTSWLMAIHNSSKLYISAVNGACAGIGTAAAMNCDLMIMAEDAYLYWAFSAIGLMPDGGANWLLLHRLGYARAIEMAVDAGRLTADECLQLGIANKVVAPDELMRQAQAWAEKLAAGAPLAQAAVKSLMRKASNMTYAEAMDEEWRLQNELVQSEDAANAVAAFFAKKQAVFKGK